jgi:hypothetical protein
MKTTFWILFSVFFLVYSSKPTIAFKPFSIEFGSPYTPFALFFLVISLTLFQLQSRKDGKYEALEKYYRIGFREGSDFTVEQINEQLKEQGKDAKISIKRDVE